jgi:hypothetical protein
MNVAPRGARLSRRLALPIAALALVSMLAACGSSKKEAEKVSDTSSSSVTSTSTTVAKSTTTKASTSTASPDLVACDVFDLAALEAATQLTWTVTDRSSRASCTISAENGNVISMSLAPTAGQNEATVAGVKSVCDPGTLVAQDIADGGYTCDVSGISSGGAIFEKDNLLVAVSAVTFNGASPEVVKAGLVDLLKSFVADN